MTIELLTKAELSFLNKRSLKYKLADAEKDYFLAIVLKIIYESPLRKTLVFKGGTAIHHCYVPQSRFSEDIDFTSLDKNISLEEIKTILTSQDFLTVRKEYVSRATIKIERLQYAGPLGLPNSLKVEIDYTQNVVSPAKELEYRNAWGVKTKVMVMDVGEVCAEKIRALGERARYRDFYDLFLLRENFDVDMKSVIALLRKKEMRKPISKASISSNWGIAKEERASETGSVYYSRNIPDAYVEKMLDEIKGVKQC